MTLRHADGDPGRNISVGAIIAGLLGEREVVAFRPALARALGSPLAALFLSQACYWQKIAGEGKWWYKKRDAERDENNNILAPKSANSQSWEYELGLSRSEQETARRILAKAGLLAVELRGVPAKNYFLVNYENLKNLLESIQLAESCQLDGETESRQLDSKIRPARRRKSSSLLADSRQQAGTIAPTIHKTTKTTASNTDTTTTSAQFPEGNSRVAGSDAPIKNDLEAQDDSDFVYPAVNETLMAALKDLLKTCQREQKQQLLDEIEGKRAQGNFKNLHGFAFSLVDACKKGRFVPSLGLEVKADRERRRKHLAASTSASTPSHDVTTEVPKEAYMALPESLKKRHDAAIDRLRKKT